MPRNPKSAVNRSQAIRDYLAKNASARAKQALATKGIEASDSLINAVKYKKPKGKRRGRRAKASVGGISVDSLIAAKQLVERAGSAEAAVQAIGW
jgi:hypothetical protein